MAALPILLLVLLLACPGATFPSGAPRSSCFSMYPGHRTGSQTGRPPYTLTFTTELGQGTRVRPGQEVTVKLSSPEEQQFKGYIVEVRKADDPTSTGPLGTFTKALDNHSRIRCNLGALTHRSWRRKSEIQGVWKVPTDLDVGSYIFRATVVKSYDTFWTDVTSPEFTL